MATKSSIKTYNDQGNEIARISHIQQIFNLFNETNCSYTIREVATVLKWDYTRCQKRITDLFKIDLLKIDGSKEEDGNPNSVYAINRTPQIFKKKRSTRIETLKSVMDKYLDSGTYAAIMEEYERMLKLEKKNKK